MQFQAAGNLTSRLWQRANRNQHSRIVAIAVLFIISFIPAWLTSIVGGVIEGQSDSILNFGFLALGLHRIYQQRQQLKTWVVGVDDRFLGYALMAAGVVTLIAVPSLSFRAMATMIIVLGIGLSSWGMAFFARYWSAVGFILFSIYPHTSFIAIRVCRFLTSENMLEHGMAWAGSLGLQMMGYAAKSEAVNVILPQGGVVVAPGCSGFDMLYTLSGCSILFGLFMRASWRRIVGLVAFSLVLALVCNVPRIMLLTIASVFWGKESFEFWHGPIGGQVFSAVMFTIYYYVAMALIEPKAKSVAKA
jgi:exosortase/archaeosortase family protein